MSAVDELLTAYDEGRAWRRVNRSDSALRFRFSDVNPVTRVPYALSQFEDLPRFAAEVVTDQVALEPDEWDALVDRAEIYDFTGLCDSYAVAAKYVRSTQCPECEGRGLAPGAPAGGGVLGERRCWLCRGAGDFWVIVAESMRPVDLLVAAGAVA